MSMSSLEEHLAYLNKLDADFFRTNDSEGIAVIWGDGAKRNKDRAAHAYLRDAEHHYRFEETPAGKYVENLGLDSPSRAALSEAAQVRMAEAAHGKVEVFAIDAPEQGFFRKDVLPAILANKDITHVNDQPKGVIDRAAPGERYNAVQASELLRDEKLGLLPDPAHPRSLYHGNVDRGPQLVPTGPREADPHPTPPSVLKEMARLEAEQIKERRREKQLERERDRDRNRDR